jgi:iron complex outermembrane receptor protein
MHRKKPHRGRLVFSAALGLAVVAAAFPARAQDEADADAPPLKSEDLLNLSLEDLMNVEITSVSKQKQKVSQAPAAVAVISQDDIRRSGLNSIPELLRLSPGLDVARLTGSTWAISSRGFNDIYANKLLVVMDGRTLYTPLFSGVYWEAADYVLADLDRIEVVRGPGATLWGANAVNGVINITSKSARDTQGWLVSGRAGNEEYDSAARYGGKIDDKTFYRVYGKWRDVDNMELAGGDDSHDGWDSLRGGFRIDRYATDKDTLTLQGDVFTSRLGQTLALPSFVPPTFHTASFGDASESGGNVLGRWTHVISDVSDFSIQAFYDRFEYHNAELAYKQDTFDVDFQHRFSPFQKQEVIWGAGFRFLADDLGNSDVMRFDPSSRDDYIANAFVQDDLTLIPDRVHLFLGTKLELNSYSGLEVQPSARLLYTPDEKNSIWLAVSRAVRTPSRFEEDGRITLNRTIDQMSGLPVTAETRGNTGLESEKLLAYEIGYRTQPTKSLSIDVAAFANVYDDLRSFDPAGPALELTPPIPHVRVPVDVQNKFRGESYGVELAANWNVTQDWRLAASYTFLTLQVHQSSSSTDVINQHSIEGSAPRNQFQIHSYYNVTKNLELNSSLYYVENLSAGDVPGYLRLDAGLTWRPKDGLEVSVGVQNALDDRHPEFTTSLNTPSNEIPRSVYAQLLWRF